MARSDDMEKEYQTKVDYETYIYYKNVRKCIDKQNQLYRIKIKIIKKEIKNKN